MDSKSEEAHKFIKKEYLCPFLYRDVFREDLNNHQFAVWFECNFGLRDSYGR